MRATFTTAALKSAIAAVMPSVARKSLKEILQNIHLRVTDDGEAIAEANNGDSAAIYRFLSQASTDQEPGECLLPADRFGKLIRELTEDEITLEAESSASGAEVVLWAGKKKFTFDAADPAEFPGFVPLTDGHRVAVAPEALRAAIERVAFACDPESHRYALSGVALTMDDGGRLTLAATNSRVLSVYAVPVPETDWEADQPPVLIPGSVMSGLTKHLDGLETVTIVATQNAAQFNLGPLTIWTRQIEGRFPPIDKFVKEPEGVIGTSIMKVGELVRCIRQAQIFASEETRGIDFDFQADSVVLAMAANSIGAAKVQLSHEYDGGKPVCVTLDSAYMLPYFRGIDGDEDVYVTLLSAEAQVRFRLGAVREDSLFVQMPLSKG